MAAHRKPFDVPVNAMPSTAAMFCARAGLLCGVLQWRKRLPSTSISSAGTFQTNVRTGRKRRVLSSSSLKHCHFEFEEVPCEKSGTIAFTSRPMCRES